MSDEPFPPAVRPTGTPGDAPAEGAAPTSPTWPHIEAASPPPAWPTPPSAPSTGSAGGWAGPSGWAPAGGGGGGAAAGPSGGWAPSGSGGSGWAGGGAGWPPPYDPWGRRGYQRERSTGGRGLVAALVAVLVAGFIGVGVGRAINSTRTVTVTQAAPVQPSGGSQGTQGNGAARAPADDATVAGVERGVVDINTKLGYQSASAAGTGMVITAKGEVLTNNHVIDGATSITATVATTGKTYTAKVLGVDATADVALLQLEGASGLSTVPLGNSSTVSTGDSVTAIGNAGGIGGAPSVVTGSVLATGQAITASDLGGANAERLSNLIEMDAPIQPGDSGGPLVNSAGKVIGMDTAASAGRRFQAASNTAFAIPINDALTVVHQIEAGQESSTVHLGLPGFLGVQVNPQGNVNGALIEGVVGNSPAGRAGIQAGDVVTAVDGHRVAQASDLTAQLRGHHPGDKVSVTWTDQSGRSHTATVTLMTGPAN